MSLLRIPTGATLGVYVDIPAVAGEDLATRDIVYIDPVGREGVVGRAYKANAYLLDKSTATWVVGFVTGAASLGEAITIRILGVLGGFSGLTPGYPQYVSVTPGEVTWSPHDDPVCVGIALSTTEILVNSRGIQSPVRKASEKGYVAGGYTGAYVATTDKLTFATDTYTAQASANLTLARGAAAGVSQAIVKGYILGGQDATSKADKIIYSTDVAAAQASANLTLARGNLAGISEYDTKGYILGGRYAGPSYTTRCDKIVFSTDTTTYQSSGNLSQIRGYVSGLSESTSKGYVAGGYDGGYLATTDKIVFSTDTTSAQGSANLSTVRVRAAGVSEGNSKGYFAGGNSGAQVATADKITFATDTTAAQGSADLSQVRDSLVGVSEGSTKGYFSGGYTTNDVGITDEITFSTDTTVTQTTATLSQARRDPAGIGDTI